MIIVTDLQGNTEPMVDTQGTEINEEVNGDFSISFTSFFTEKNAYSYPLLQEESIVELDGHEFRVKNLVEVRNKKTVTAPHVFFDLIDHQVYGINGGTKTVNEFFGIVLAGTGWTFENVDVSHSALIPNFGEGNALSLTRQICTAFQCEIKIEPNRHLKIYKQIGRDTDEQFRYKHNIKTLKKSVDTSKLATVIKGYGGDGLEVTYTSPNYHLFGKRHAEPVRDERYTISSSLIERCKQELVDFPEVSYELEVTQLGYDAQLGDSLWTMYEPMGIEFKQRIMAYKWFPFSNKIPVVTLSSKKQTFSDLLTETRIEINENQKQTRSKFEQTNERITMEVERVDESISKVEQTADEIKSTVETELTRIDGALEESNSLISQTASTIRSEVQTEITRLDGEIEDANSSIIQTAASIRSEVQAEVERLDGAVDIANSSIAQLANSIILDVNQINSDIGIMQSQLSVQAGQISSKVSYTDYNGNTIASLINQTAEAVVIDAQKINLLGITNVAQSLQIGSAANVGHKELRFNGGNVINDNGTTMSVSAQFLTIGGGSTYFTNSVDFSGANVSGLNVTARFG